MAQHVLKWPVPVDGTAHLIGGGPVALVAVQNEDDPEAPVMVWTVEDSLTVQPTRTVEVYGTGHPVPDGLDHLGSTITYYGRLVWHCYAEPTESP